MASFQVEHLKALAYDEIADLAIAARIKVLRAGETTDIKAILDEYFHRSLGVMRRTGMKIKLADR